MKPEDVIKRILELGYYPVTLPCAGGGAQFIDGTWYVLRWGCDTLEHIRDSLLQEDEK